IAGFVGFEPRVRDGTTPCRLTGDPPAGHELRIDVREFQLPPELVGGTRATVRTARDFPLSIDASTIPMPPAGAIAYALVAALTGAEVELVVVAGPVSPVDRVARATDEDVAAAVGVRRWVRIADVEIRRSASGDKVFPSVVPALPP